MNTSDSSSTATTTPATIQAIGSLRPPAPGTGAAAGTAAEP